MGDDGPTVGELHPKLQPIRARAIARGRPFEVVGATELAIAGAVGPGFLSQAATFVCSLMGLRGALDAPEAQRPYTYVYSVGPGGRVRKERLWVTYRT